MSIHQPTPKENPLPEEIQNYINYLEEQIKNIREEFIVLAKEKKQNIQALPESEKQKAIEKCMQELEPYKYMADRLKILIKIIKNDNGQAHNFTEAEKMQLDVLNQHELKRIIQDETLTIRDKILAIDQYEASYKSIQSSN